MHAQSGADSELEALADAFADDAHRRAKQVRKYTGEPYIVHPRAVAAIVKSVDHTPAMVAAALLHDTIEDTDVTEADVRRVFGDEVAALVVELTDASRPEDGNRAARKAIDRARLGAASAAAQTVKLADVIHNAGDIAAHDPNFARVYLREMSLLLPLLVRGDAQLHARACRIIGHYRGKLRAAAAPAPGR